MDADTLTIIFSHVPFHGSNWSNIMKTCKLWNAVGRRLFSSVSISAVVKSYHICPIVVVRHLEQTGYRYTIKGGKAVPFSSSSTNMASLSGSSLFIAESAQGKSGCNLKLYHNHADFYTKLQWELVGQVFLPLSVTSIHALSSTSCLIGTKETTVYLVAGHTPSSLKITSGFPDFAMPLLEEDKKQEEELKKISEIYDKETVEDICGRKRVVMEADRRSHWKKLGLAQKSVDFFVVSPDKRRAVAEIAMNNSFEMMCISRYIYRDEKGNILRIFSVTYAFVALLKSDSFIQVDETELTVVGEMAHYKGKRHTTYQPKHVSGVTSIGDDAFLVSRRAGGTFIQYNINTTSLLTFAQVIEALKLDESKESKVEDDIENKIVSIKHFNLNGKVLGMRKKGAIVHMIVLLETELSYVIMQFNQKTQDFEIIGKIHLEKRKTKFPYRDYALL